MEKYGQYCPVAQALDVLGDRWTLLILRDMLNGSTQFNHLERGLPGISRPLLAKRLRQLEEAKVIEKRFNPSGRQTTGYYLTEAGMEVKEVMFALITWGAAWAFNEPTPEELDPILLMWWMHNRVCFDQLPEERVVIQFDFHWEKHASYWLMLTTKEAAVCMTHPGYEVNVLVTANLAAFYKLWLGRIEYDEALKQYGMRVDAIPRLAKAFPNWFAWSMAAPGVRTVRRRQEALQSA